LTLRVTDISVYHSNYDLRAHSSHLVMRVRKVGRNLHLSASTKIFVACKNRNNRRLWGACLPHVWVTCIHKQ